MRQLKLLYIASDKFPPFRADVSILFGKEMVKRGHRITWLLQAEEELTRSYVARWSGCTVCVGATDPGPSKTSRARKNVLAFLHDMRVFRLLSRSEYDFVMVRDKFMTALPALIAAKMYGRKLIYWLSYPFPEDFTYQAKNGTAKFPLLFKLKGLLFGFLLYRVILRMSEHVFVQSEHMRKNISGHGIPGEKMTPVPMGVSMNGRFQAQPKMSPNGHKSVVYLGTLARGRHMEFLIHAFKTVLEKKRNAKLVLVGGGDDCNDEQWLKSEAKRLGIEKYVTITGFIPQQEAWSYVSSADVCVSPIYPAPILDCGSPTKLIEYMAMGKAVVANEHPEQAVVLAESKAGLCVPYDENAFAQAIAYILDHPEEADAMGRLGRRYVKEKRSYEVMANRVEKTLCKLLSHSES